MSNTKLIPELRFPEFENDGEWQIKSFNELFEIGNGRDYKHLKEGNIPVYGSGGYMLSVDEFLYDGESACIGRKGTIDKPMFLTGKFWTVDTLFYTHSFNNCLPKYIYYVFQNINWLKHNEAGGVPSLSKTNIYKIQNLVPKPDEQQKITLCLSSLDELIAAHNDKLGALKDHKKGLMQNLFPQEGQKVPNYRFPEFENDGEWQKSTFGKYFKNLTTGMTPSRKKPEYYTGNIPWITSGELDYNTVLKTKESITEEAVKDTSLRIYKPGTFFIAITGLEAPGTRGRCAINGVFATTNQSCMAFEKVPEFHNEFLFHWYMNFSESLYSLSQGTKQQSFNNKIVEGMEIIHPKPKEQQKIASCLSALDDLIIAQTKKIEQLHQHKKGLMQGLFPGSSRRMFPKIEN